MPHFPSGGSFRASLLDRLTDKQPQAGAEAVPWRTQNREALKTSVLQNLEWVLNCRAANPKRWFSTADLTVIDYGIPDFGATSPENLEHRTELARIITRCLEHFEPRLREVRVQTADSMPDESSLRVRISGILTSDPASAPFSFETIYQDKTGVWKLHEHE